MKTLTRLDIFVIAAIVLLSLASLLLFKSSGGTVVVTENNVEIYRGSIDVDAVIKTRSKHNTVTISHGCVYMSDADCKDKLCMRMGKLTAAQPIVCIPNGVCVTLENDSPTWDFILK